MKKTLVLLLLLQAFLSCNGQKSKITETTYTQKLEFGLKGSVKEVTGYMCRVENDKIPTDTSKYIGKTTMTFDSLGNMIEKNKLWDLGIGKVGTAEFSSVFSGTGKDLSFQETSHTGDDDLKKISYKYVWSDDYNYTIVSPEDTTHSSIITLDKDYRLIKSVFKEEDVIQSTEEWETVYKNDKVQEIKTKITEKSDGKPEVSYQIQVMQKYDNNGNPTVIYVYKDIGKQKVVSVIYKKYKYY